MEKNFPQGFFWGAATSSHQVEGNNFNNWSEWEKENAQRLAQESEKRFSYLKNWPKIKKEAKDPQNYISGRACDFWNLYEKDFDLLKELNLNAFRFSLEWSRIEPEQGKFSKEAIDHYKKMIEFLRQRNIEPFVTLWHFSNPLWFEKNNGWSQKQAPEIFEKYVKFVVDNLKDSVIFFITLNEPEIYTSHSFLRGIWSPQKENWLKSWKVLKNFILSHKKAYQIIKKQNKKAQIGIAKNNIYFKGGLFFLARYLWNYSFLNAIKNYQDFIGLNYYFKLKFLKSKNKKTTDMGWEIYPKGIFKVLLDLKKYKKPVYITENGLADKEDFERKEFILEHLKWVHQAIENKVEIKGYFYWSLLDNFEWDKGFWPRFGLVEVDYKTLERKIRPSAYFFSEIAKKNKIK